MHIRYMAVGALAYSILVGCTETTRQPMPEDIMDWPEAQRLSACLDVRVAYFATKVGNALDLGYLASQACASEREAFLMRAANGNRSVVNKSRQEFLLSNASMAAEMIIISRGY